MNLKTSLSPLLILILLIWLVAGCGGLSTEPTTAPVPATPIETVTATIESGFITGRVHGQAPPTPAMVVYAVDNTTGAWNSVETQATDGEAPFTLEVPPGNYQVFAFARDGAGPYTGYAADGLALSTVTVAAGQTVSDIMVRPPGMSECGPTFGLPASPDGRFAAIDGPTEDCVAAPESPAPEPPPMVALPDGTHCAFAGTGATLAFDGKRLNYTCDVAGQEVGLLGDLQLQSDGAWLAEKVMLGHNDSGFFIQESEMVAVTAVDEDTDVGLANPASVFCEEQGGRLEIRTEDSGQVGGQLGYCVFPDGSECEEWDFFRGECLAMSSVVCHDLLDDMAQALGVEVTLTAQSPFEDYINGQTGTGCRLTATGSGLDFENVGAVYDQVTAVLQSQNWLEDMQYAGGGATGLLTGFRQGDELCLFVVEWEPSADANCPSDQPISACELSPEQMLYTITLNCAQDNTVALPKTEPERIEFGPDAISSQVQGTLPASGLAQYVLTAMAGQQMTVNLTTTDPATVNAILVIWGLDGTVLISDHAGATTWTGELPLTQDYFIDVRSVGQNPVDYTMEVIIPPPASATPSGPTIESFTIEAQDNASGGKNLILTWQTTGANKVEIWRGEAYTAYKWDGEPDGTLTIEYGPDEAYNAQDFNLIASDDQGNSVSQSNVFKFPCRYHLFFDPDSDQCASHEAGVTAAAEQPFEHGRMLWLEELRYSPEHAIKNSIVVLYEDGTWEKFEDTWQPGEPESDPAIVPTGGLYQPVRGFGKLWRDENLNIREQLGWGLVEEQDFEAVWQDDTWFISPSAQNDKAYIRTSDGQIIRLDGPGSGRWEVVNP